MKTLVDIVTQVRKEWPSVIRCAVLHRLGNVPVGETSILIGVSSPHRSEAFKACESILEQVKIRAQIWKREWYEGDDATWKANFPIAGGDQNEHGLAASIHPT